MADYKEQIVEAKPVRTWTRCAHIEIRNPHSSVGVPSIRFIEQRAVESDGVVTVAYPSDWKPLDVPFDPAAVIPLVDTDTLLPTGATVTMGAVYAILFSAYINQATLRDEG